MFTENLYKTVLIDPVHNGATQLFVVSGYASAAFTARHIEDILNISQQVQVRLLIGMFPQVGNLSINHPAFKRLSTTDFPLRFECRYNTQSPPVHSKVYSWYRGGKPVQGFVGSANYSNNGFENNQREAVMASDPAIIHSYFQSLWDYALDCRENEADRLVTEAIEKYKRQRAIIIDNVQELSQHSSPGTESDYFGLP